MRPTKLVLVEGIPGAGKSTLAHAILRQLRAQGLAAHWWYEEVVGHPVYCFRTRAELVQVVEDLSSGRYRRVIAAALDQWRSFAATVAAGDETVLLDGCLFGYLTWSLFPFAVPEAEILDYVAEVAAILAGLDPCLVYLRHDDMAAAWRWLAERRGDDWTRGAIGRATGSPYGQRLSLADFPGLVSFWQAFQDLADTAFERLQWPTVRCSANAAERDDALPAALRLLQLPQSPEPDVAPSRLAHHAGTYVATSDDENTPLALTLILLDNSLRLDGLHQFWPLNRLIPLPTGDFAVESFPHTIRFLPDGSLTITGQALLSGPIAETWHRQGTDASRRSA